MDSRLRAAELLPLAPAAATPLLFLHPIYRAQASFEPIAVFSSDIAVAAITVAAALFAGAWWGFVPLRRARTLWAVVGVPLDALTRLGSGLAAVVPGLE